MEVSQNRAAMNLFATD